MVECVECGKALELENKEEGEIIECRDCGAEFELVSVNPPKIQAAPEVKEDWGE